MLYLFIRQLRFQDVSSSASVFKETNLCIYQLAHLITTHWTRQAVQSTMGTLQSQQRLLRVLWL